MRKQNTKRSLVMSVISLLLCFSMLLGTTFAWFTDSVTSSNNIIKSGTLDVAMYWAKGEAEVPSATGNWEDASKGAIFDYDLWEPGFVQARHIKIANEGTLALKYQVSIEANGEVSELSDVIDVYYYDPAVKLDGRDALTESNKLGTLTQVLAGLDESAQGTLTAGAEDTITIAFKMQESAGNEYQNLAIGSDFSVKLFATQLTYETDSFDNQYDTNAPYNLPAGTTAEDFGSNVAYVDGTYYSTLNAALIAIHNSGAEASTLYLKPNADLGIINHAHVCSSITIYGNNAYISGGERDFEIGIPQTATCTIDSPVALTVNNLDGCAVWGTIPENANVSVTLNDCENVSKISLPNYSTGNYDLSVKVNNCTFVGTDAFRDSAIWCRGLDNLTVSNTTFKNYAVGINQNNKDAVENYTLADCTFIDCATPNYVTTQTSYAAPVRAVASKAGAVTNLTMTNCSFVYTNGASAINGDVLTSQSGDQGVVNVTNN